jgi:hypothetical protein
MKIALIDVEGVLAQGDLRSAPPQKWAIPLYGAIRSQFRTVALTRGVQDLARDWLRKEGFPDWSAVIAWNTSMAYKDWVLDQVREFLANGWEVAFLITLDDEISRRAMDLGVLTLTIGVPMRLPGWKSEDEGFTPWNKLESRAS